MKGRIIWIAVLAVVAASLIFGSFRDRKEKATVTVPPAELRSDDFDDFRGDFRSEMEIEQKIAEQPETLDQPPVAGSEWVMVENPVATATAVPQKKKKGLAALFQKRKSSSSRPKPLLHFLFHHHH